MRKKNATQRRRISYYSGWRTRLERKSHFYFWSLWRWVHGAHVSLTTTIYWLQTFSRHADKLFVVALQRQWHEGDLVWEGKAAYLLTLWAGGMAAEQPRLTSHRVSQLLLRAEGAARDMGFSQRPRKVGSCNGLQPARDSRAVCSQLLPSWTWLGNLLWAPGCHCHQGLMKRPWATCSQWPCLSMGRLKRWPPEVPSPPNQSVIQWTSELREESPRYEGC